MWYSRSIRQDTSDANIASFHHGDKSTVKIVDPSQNKLMVALSPGWLKPLITNNLAESAKTIIELYQFL